jgi:undecaprenyl-diphosphatase
VLGSALQLDRHALIWINSHHSLLLDAILAPVAYAGEAGALWFALSLGLLIFGRREHRITGLVLLVSIILVDRLIAAPLGAAFFRTRPYLALEGVRQLGVRWSGTSFPSGHAHSVWMAAIILSNQWRRLTVPLVLFGLLTCYSRPYFGMHYPLDVVAGSAIGLSAGLLVVSGRRAWKRYRAHTCPTPMNPALQ